MKHFMTYLKNILTIAVLLFTAFLCACASSPPLSETSELTKTDEIQEVIIAESNLDSYELNIPEISGEYSFLFLTDSHITIPDGLDSKTVRDYSAHRLSQFRQETGLVSSQIFTAFMHFAKEKSLDGLLLGGDIIDSPSSANIKFLSDSLKILKIPYIYTLGNHDWTYPWEYMTENAVTKYLSALSPYMEENPAIHTQEFEDFTIVSVDNSSNQINPAALDEYKKILSAKKPVILMLHVPLYTESLLTKTSKQWTGSVVLGGGIHGGFYPNNVSAEFITLTTAKDSPVVLVLAGHVHLADKSHIVGEKSIPQITGDAAYKGKASVIHIN